MRDVSLAILAECRDDLRVPVNAQERSKRPGDYSYWGSNSVQGTIDGYLTDGPTVLLGEDGAPFFDAGRPVAFYVDEPIWPNNHVHVLKPRTGTDPRWLTYALNAVDYSLYVKGSTRDKLNQSEMMSIRLPWTASGIQIAVADYLDRETSEIDAMIANLDKLAVRIRERRGALWSSTFAQGFEMQRLQWSVQEIDERAGTALVDLPMLSVSIHHGIQRREDSTSQQRAGEDLRKYKVARGGDIVVNRMRAFQGGLGRTSVDGLVSPDYAVLRPINDFSSRWGEYVMRSSRFVAEMSRRLRGIGGADQTSVRTPRINVRDLVLIHVPVPDPDSLQAATEHLDEVTARINQMLAKVADLKTLLLERRSTLITDVVTGRKDIA